MSDIDAAVERLQDHIARQSVNDSPYAKRDEHGEAYFDSDEMEFDTFKTSRAYLELADPTPIDEAWLREMEGYRDGGLHVGEYIIRLRRNGIFLFRCLGDASGGMELNITTRGQFRSLLLALGAKGA